jgi:TonB family protein
LFAAFRVSAQEEIADSIKLDSIPATIKNAVSIEEFTKSNKPKFNGKDVNTFSKWVTSKIKYPSEALRKNQKGKIIICFTIDTLGNVTDLELVLGISKELNAEAMRVVSSSPRWTPGYINGKPVNVRFCFPVTFGIPDGYKYEERHESRQPRWYDNGNINRNNNRF